MGLDRIDVFFCKLQASGVYLPCLLEIIGDFPDLDIRVVGVDLILEKLFELGLDDEVEEKGSSSVDDLEAEFRRCDDLSEKELFLDFKRIMKDAYDLFSDVDTFIIASIDTYLKDRFIHLHCLLVPASAI